MIKKLTQIPIGLTIHFISQMCAALSYAHSKHIIHRDINPSNIIIQSNDRLKILDFGLSCPLGTEDFSNAGTAYYMAPEQINGDPVDGRTDIYAMGICAYEMVTGQKPYQHNDLNKLLDLHLAGQLPDPAEIAADIPEALRQFIMTAAHRDPEQRYLSAGQAFEALRPVQEKYHTFYSGPSLDKRKVTSVFMISDEEHQLGLKRLLEEFCLNAQKLGVEVRVAEFIDDN